MEEAQDGFTSPSSPNPHQRMTVQSFQIGLASDLPAVLTCAGRPPRVPQPSQTTGPTASTVLQQQEKLAGDRCLQDNSDEASGCIQRVLMDTVPLSWL